MPKPKGLPFSLDPLDKRFVPPKPKNSVEDDVVYALEKAGREVLTRKRNGNYLSAVITGSAAKRRVRLYTRGKVEDVTDHYPHIASDLLEMPFPASGTVLGTEVVVEKDGNDNLEALQSIAKSNPKRACVLQEAQGYAKLMIYNVFVFDGVSVADKPYQERLGLIDRLFSGTLRPVHITPVEILTCSFAEARMMVRARGWEGLVIYDATKPTEFRLDGKEDRPARPTGCWKWKPILEDDFIARGFNYGSGRNKNRMGELLIYQVNPRTGQEVPCGKAGGGFSAQEREWFAREAKYPLVVQLKFRSRFPSGALFGADFMRVRDDKEPAACLLPEELTSNAVLKK